MRQCNCEIEAHALLGQLTYLKLGLSHILQKLCYMELLHHCRVQHLETKKKIQFNSCRPELSWVMTESGGWLPSLFSQGRTPCSWFYQEIAEEFGPSLLEILLVCCWVLPANFQAFGDAVCMDEPSPLFSQLSRGCNGWFLVQGHSLVRLVD